MPTPTELNTALERLIHNERVTLIRVSVSADACPACHAPGTVLADHAGASPAEMLERVGAQHLDADVAQHDQRGPVDRLDLVG